MKYLFNNIAPVKKEAKTIKKTFSKYNLEFNFTLQEIQDLVARFYGWTHYNELSIFQDKLNSKENKDLFKELSLEGACYHEDFESDSYRLIASLSTTEKLGLFQNKVKIITSYLESKNTGKEKIDEIVNFTLSKRSFFSLFTNMINKESEILSFMDIPKEKVKQGYVVTGCENEKKARILKEYHIPQSIHRGGFFVVNEEVFRKIIPHALSVYGITQTPYTIFDYSDTDAREYDVLDMSNSYNVRGITDLMEVRSSIAGYLTSDRKGKFAQIKEEALSFWNTLICYYVDQYGEQTSLKSIYPQPMHDSTDFIDHLLEELRRNHHFDEKNDARDSLLIAQIQNMKGFSLSAIEDSRRQPQEFYDNFAFIFSQLSQAFQSLAIHGELGRAGLRETMRNKGVVFIVVSSDDKYYLNPQAKAHLCSFRDEVIKQLGMSLENPDGYAKNEENESRELYPVFLDQYDTYSQCGFGVVSAQLRARNISTWFCMPDLIFSDDSSSLISQEEASSIVANIDSYLFLSNESFILNFDSIINKFKIPNKHNRLEGDLDKYQTHSLAHQDYMANIVTANDYAKDAKIVYLDTLKPINNCIVGI